MHKLEAMTMLAAESGIERGTGLPTGNRLLASIVGDEPSLRGIVTLQNVGSRGHIGVGQTTSNEFIAVGTTPDGAVVRYSAVAPHGLV